MTARDRDKGNTAAIAVAVSSILEEGDDPAASNGARVLAAAMSAGPGAEATICAVVRAAYDLGAADARTAIVHAAKRHTRAGSGGAP